MNRHIEKSLKQLEGAREALEKFCATQNDNGVPVFGTPLAMELCQAALAWADADMDDAAAMDDAWDRLEAAALDFAGR